MGLMFMLVLLSSAQQLSGLSGGLGGRHGPGMTGAFSFSSPTCQHREGTMFLILLEEVHI